MYQVATKSTGRKFAQTASHLLLCNNADFLERKKNWGRNAVKNVLLYQANISAELIIN